MSKNNIEIVAEIISDATAKFEKLLEENKSVILQFENVIEKASSSNFELKTDRLEELIHFQNELFLKQRKAVEALNIENLSKLKLENKRHQIFCYLFCTALIIILILNKIKL